MELKTDRLILRPLTSADVKTAHEYASDEEVCKYMIFLPNKTEQETLEYLKAVEDTWTSDNQLAYEFAVCLNGSHVGTVSLAIENELTEELGWIFNSEYQGNGYCTEAAFAVVRFAERLGIKRLVAHCDTRNTPSYRVMEKLGMTRVSEGQREYFDERGVAQEYEYELFLS